MVTTAAVVVTFNRLEKLKAVIESVRAQIEPVETLILIDNASTDGTREYLATLRDQDGIDVVTMPRNVGGAGGFAEGMRRGYGTGADFVWIMDDDCYPESTALAELTRGFADAVDELGPDVPFACSVVKFTDGTICEMNNPVPTWDWGRLLVKGQRNVMVTTCSFVSVLVPRWAIAEYGLPYAEYFIWFDDREYTLRLTRRCPGVQVLDSVVIHDMGENRGVNFGMVDPASVWKFEHGVRNEASYLFHHRGLLYYIEFGARLAVSLHRGRVPLPLRARLFKKWLAGVTFNPQVAFPDHSPEDKRPNTHSRR
ncbi:glycosyltransferase family 2 protein [Microbacterium sp. cx-55]|uniref:glycosyltransferase family 2 protein n=1 Tax=Microbacterium sp. cx-55 TaxID=2875948 RepID=UPI001CBF4566|nr:glycosyltransferase family 2 protein [Microbacterium sp. cx-55]MBZ4487084.1 glycosyltransferase family 2 protein [Microbacterium sp. cx-55]UGB35998.1 glycosyltransferase family 2 protein [Microbacterium sp. cx-55]